MSLMTETCMGRVPQKWDGRADPKARLRRVLEDQYRGQPSALARDLECSKKQAENLLLGHWPGPVTFSAIVRRFGTDILDIIFGDEIAATKARLQAEVRQLEEALERKRASLGQADGAVARPPGGMAPVQDRAAVAERPSWGPRHGQ